MLKYFFVDLPGICTVMCFFCADQTVKNGLFRKILGHGIIITFSTLNFQKKDRKLSVDREVVLVYH